MNNVRKAAEADVDAIAAIYDAIHEAEERGDAQIGWIRGVYPTRQTALAALEADDLFVMEGENGVIVAAARINHEQVPVYADAQWRHDAPADKVMVLHTLVVDPAAAGRGLGREFVAFYERYALECGCPFLRMDTNQRNLRARALYAKLGYEEVDIVPCEFNGIPDVMLICLEKRL